MSAVERDKARLEKFHTEEPRVSFNPTLKLTRELTQGPGLLRVQDVVHGEGERKDVMPPRCRFPPTTFLLHLLLLQPWSRRSHRHYPEAPVRVRRAGGGDMNHKDGNTWKTWKPHTHERTQICTGLMCSGPEIRTFTWFI